MTWNGSPLTTIKGTCAVCAQPYERKVSIHTARQIKGSHCGKRFCAQKLSRQRAKRVKA